MTLKEILILFEGRLVGGAVRNKLLKLPVKDYDIATPLLPKIVTKRAYQAGLKPIPVGIEHGTVLVLCGDTKYEVTTLREDITTDGRHAEVKFGTSFEQDALRRDFTMNALSEDADGKIYDYVGGLADIEARKVCFIGEAEKRITEDYLRILRFFRFTALYGEAFDPEGLAACAAHRTGLSRLSKERVLSEMLKILAAPRYLFALEAMANTGVLDEILRLPFTLASINSEDPLLRLAMLCVHEKEEVVHLRKQLKLDNAQTRRLETVVVGFKEIATLKTELDVKKMLYLCGKRTVLDRILLAESRFNLDLTWMKTLVQTWHIPTFPLRGEDLKREGFVEGAAMGQELLKRKEAWMKNDFQL